MNEYFVNATDSLGKNEKSGYENATEGVTYTADNVQHKCFNHYSSLKLKNHCQQDCFSTYVNSDAVDLEIRVLNPKKATVHKDIQSKILKNCFRCMFRTIGADN